MTRRSTPPLWAVIMAGGSGTRFWPVSKNAMPKQFLPPGGGIPPRNAGPTLLELTLKRARGFAPPERTLVMASAAHKKFLRNLEIPKRNVVHEPEGRNTAPCLGLAARLIESREPGALMCAVPADQHVGKTREFQKLIRAGARLARAHDSIVSLGAPPHSPETGFGYIERGERVTPTGEIEAFRAKRFREKPPLAQARRYAASGKHYWNSGIFISRAACLIEELESRLPRLGAVLCRAASAYAKRDTAAFAKLWKKCESISIDHAVMEKSRNLIVLPADVGWSDLGTWPALRGVLARDEAGNVWILPKGGRTESIDAKNLIVRSNKKLVAAVGVEDVIVVETDDALLICSIADAEKIGEMVKNLGKGDAKFL
ncbi:MAG: sugar phosphate nucleotidyltransferase [Nitrospinae bacterium]|nr:sugar phosphate nucleotidyltransferase [Nitrospinota bacterium]